MKRVVNLLRYKWCCTSNIAQGSLSVKNAREPCIDYNRHARHFWLANAPKLRLGVSRDTLRFLYRRGPDLKDNKRKKSQISADSADTCRINCIDRTFGIDAALCLIHKVQKQIRVSHVSLCIELRTRECSHHLIQPNAYSFNTHLDQAHLPSRSEQ